METGHGISESVEQMRRQGPEGGGSCGESQLTMGRSEIPPGLDQSEDQKRDGQGHEEPGQDRARKIRGGGGFGCSLDPGDRHKRQQ